MNVKSCLIRELILYEFEVAHEATKDTQIIHCVKGECTGIHIKVTVGL